MNVHVFNRYFYSKYLSLDILKPYIYIKVGKHPNVVNFFLKMESETKRTAFSNSLGRDMTTNTGRHNQVEAANKAIRSLVARFGSLPEASYLTLMAHTLVNYESK